MTYKARNEATLTHMTLTAVGSTRLLFDRARISTARSLRSSISCRSGCQSVATSGSQAFVGSTVIRPAQLE
jgi:hypothetical protein